MEKPLMHDSNNRNEERIVSMRSTYGMRGYGLYWCLLEKMAEEKNYKLTFKNIKGIAFGLNEDVNYVEQFVNDCIKNEIFKKDKEYFWSKTLTEQMQRKDEKSSKARDSALTRWNKEIEPSLKILVDEIINLWNSKGLKQGEGNIYRAYNKARKKYAHLEIIQAIERYIEVLNNSDKYFFQYRWTLDEFLLRTGMKHFSNDECFIKFKKGNNYGRQTIGQDDVVDISKKAFAIANKKPG